MILLAQADLGGVPAATFKWVFIILIGLAVAAAFIWTAIRPDKKQSVKFERDDQPVDVRKSPKRYNHDATEVRFTTLEQKSNEHSAQISKLWETLRVDLPAMERRLNEAGEERSSAIHDRVNEILKEVGRLEGKMENRK
jgi:hypothetical protein